MVSVQFNKDIGLKEFDIITKLTKSVLTEKVNGGWSHYISPYRVKVTLKRFNEGGDLIHTLSMTNQDLDVLCLELNKVIASHGDTAYFTIKFEW